MRSTPLLLRDGEHLVRDIPLTRYLRRTLHDPHLMTYYHRREKSWVIGSWVNRLAGVVLEHCTILPGEASEAVLQLRWQRSEASRKDAHEMARLLKSSERDDLRKQAEEAEEEEDFINFIRSRCPTMWQDHPYWSWC